MKKLKIAFTGNVFPMSKNMAYGGERILYYLADALGKRGHEVHVFAREGSDFRGTHIYDYTPVPALRNDCDVHYEVVKQYEKDHKTIFDIYQCNYFGDGFNPEVLSKYNYCELTWCVWSHMTHQLKFPAFNTITYSKVMQQDFLNLGFNTQMIHYGIPKELYQPNYKPDDYAVWIGKIEGGKAPRLAIELAKSAGLKIVLMGPPYNTNCFWEQIAPYIDNQRVFWVRGVDDYMKQKIMSRAKVFISSNDNTWKEHFGIVNIEALACGTPILAFNRINQECAIAVDKIIENGKHGFFLNYFDSTNLMEILEKGVPLLKKIWQIDRKECRKQYEENFTIDLMAKRFEFFYNEIQNGRRITEALDLTHIK